VKFLCELSVATIYTAQLPVRNRTRLSPGIGAAASLTRWTADAEAQPLVQQSTLRPHVGHRLPLRRVICDTGLLPIPRNVQTWHVPAETQLRTQRIVKPGTYYKMEGVDAGVARTATVQPTVAGIKRPRVRDSDNPLGNRNSPGAITLRALSCRMMRIIPRVTLRTPFAAASRRLRCRTPMLN
jgi:hypothetical protein